MQNEQLKRVDDLVIFGGKKGIFLRHQLITIFGHGLTAWIQDR